MTLKELFPVSFVVNLPSREDRWDSFCRRMEDDWPFGKIVRFPAINGQLAPPPSWWTAGAGAWGCYRSHLQILETCLSNQIDRVLILEDDAFLVDQFEDKCKAFFGHLPTDWKLIYLGGEHLEPSRRLPTRINDWVYRPYNVNRTHGYAIQGLGTIRDIYCHLNETQAWRKGHHIDHHYGEWQKKQSHGIYVPAKWLVGQTEGLSSITYKKEQSNLWLGAEELAFGTIDRPMAAVLGVYRGGTSCMAGVLQRLGIELGPNLKAARQENPTGFYEDELLGEVCRNIFSEPWLTRQAGQEQSMSLLRWWASKRCRDLPGDDKGMLAGKHPLLSLLVQELELTWNHPKFIVLNRPVADSLRSLKKTGWGWPVEAMEYVLPRMMKSRDEALEKCGASHLRVDFDLLRQNPRSVISEVIEFLECFPSDSQIQSAIDFVQQA